jgi:hypothetical protein
LVGDDLNFAAALAGSLAVRTFDEGLSTGSRDPHIASVSKLLDESSQEMVEELE